MVAVHQKQKQTDHYRGNFPAAALKLAVSLVPDYAAQIRC